MDTPEDGNAAGQKSARPVTAAWLERVALHYLDRYGASAEMLRRVLARRVEKQARLRGEDPESYAGLITETVARAERAGLIDDARFAAARLASLRRRGTSARAAGAALAQRGVARDVIAGALDAESGEDDAAESAAAAAYAKRRRLGPHRPPQTRAEHRERDLAAMARAGFPFALARAVIDAGGDAPDDEWPHDEPPLTD